MRHGDHDASQCIELRCGTSLPWPADQAAAYHQGRVDEAAHAPVPAGIYEDDHPDHAELEAARRGEVPSFGGYQPGPPAHVHDRDLPCNVKCPAWPRCRACGRAAWVPSAPCHDCPDAPGRVAEANHERPGAAPPGPGIALQGPASQRRSGVPGPATPDGGDDGLLLTISRVEGLAARIVSVLYRAAESVPMPEDTRTALHDAIARELGAEARRAPG